MQRVKNFNAGPAALPRVVLERAHTEWFDFAGSGISVLETSHRHKAYEALQEDAAARIGALYNLPASHTVLFLQGGASSMFATLPLNALGGGRAARYIVTGTWGEKAAKEAAIVAKLLHEPAPIVATTKQATGWAYDRVPSHGAFEGVEGAAYVHVTTNETVDGVQYASNGASSLPPVHAPLVADMSSDFLSRPAQLGAYACAYAGAQKNAGPSGVTLVVVEKAWAEACRKDIPIIFQFRTAIEHRSLYNTPPTLGIYLVREVLRWVADAGGLPAMEQLAERKAARLYDAVAQSHGFYTCPVSEAARSRMNVVFRLPNEELETAFLTGGETLGMLGLKGHRVVGGIRASLYNAVEEGWVQELVEYMNDFRAKQGH